MKKPITYNISPAKGQALLNFEGRRYPESVELFETQLIEEVRPAKEQKLFKKDKQNDLNSDFRNLLIHGDCLSACAYLKSKNIKVDLVYIDPPFASGANYSKKIYLRNGGRNELNRQNQDIGEEIMYGDIWQKEDYLNWLYERLSSIRDVMSSEATIYLHIDSTIGHYVKVIMDEIFGDWEFAEIIWVCGLMGSGDYYPKAHETIYCYRTEKSFFNSPQKLGLSPRITGALSNDDKGWFYTRGRESSGGSTYLKTYITNNPNLSKEDAIEEANKTRSNPVWSVWMGKDELGKAFNENGVGTYAYTENENVGYSTQKPEALLKRIINASSEKGYIVADFFGGSGVTSKVSNDLERKFIACDIGVNAIHTTRDRLKEAKAEFDILKINDGIRLFRNPAQTTAKIFSLIDGFKIKSELDLGDFWDGGIINKKGNYTPVKFIGIHEKLSKELIDVILEQVYQIDDEVEGVKIIYAHKDFDADQSYINKEINKVGKTDLRVELISVDELLSQKADVLFTPDTAQISIKKDGSKFKVEIENYFSSYLKNKIDDFNAKKVKKTKQASIEDESEVTEPKEKFKPIKISDKGLELIESVQFDTTLRKDNVWISNPDLEDKAKIKEKIKGKYTLSTNKFKIKIRNIAGDEIIIDSPDLS